MKGRVSSFSSFLALHRFFVARLLPYSPPEITEPPSAHTHLDGDTHKLKQESPGPCAVSYVQTHDGCTYNYSTHTNFLSLCYSRTHTCLSLMLEEAGCWAKFESWLNIRDQSLALFPWSCPIRVSLWSLVSLGHITSMYQHSHFRFMLTFITPLLFSWGDTAPQAYYHQTVTNIICCGLVSAIQACQGCTLLLAFHLHPLVMSFVH